MKMGRNTFTLLVMMGLAMMLGGCGKSVTRNFRVIATAEVDGQKVEGSTVMQVTYTLVNPKYSLTGRAGAEDLKGEALILDLKGKGTVFILPWHHYEPKTHGSLQAYFVGSPLGVLGVQNTSPGTFNEDKLNRVRHAVGRYVLNTNDYFPLFVAFQDERVPRSIYEVDPLNLGAAFPGARFLDLSIEFTDDPITNVIRKRLPWLTVISNNLYGTQFERDPPGHVRADRDTPIQFKISERNFFAIGSHR